MGRHPNPLLLTFFNRGPKLEDNSNRYSWTCKGCAADFPKGRDNHLLNHLTSTSNRCSALTDGDIARIAEIQAAKTAERAQKEASRNAADSGLTPIVNEPPSNGRVSASTQAFHGLEALAEASQQVERPTGAAPDLYPTTDKFDITPEEHQNTIDPTLTSTTSASQASAQYLTGTAAPATSPGELLHYGGSRSNGEDTFAGSELQRFLYEAVDLDALNQLTQAASFPTPIAPNTTLRVANYSHDPEQPPTKVVKVRSKFSEERKDQVNKVRERGACLRCRMLRKTCSFDKDPCGECEKIQNPRSWLIPCRRERIWQMCQLYSSSVYLYAAKSGVDGEGPDRGFADDGTAFTIQYTGATEPSVALPAALLFPKLEDRPVFESGVLVTRQNIEAAVIQKLLDFLSKAPDDEYSEQVKVTMGVDLTNIAANKRQLFTKAVTLYKLTHILTSPAQTFTLSDPDGTQQHLPSPILTPHLSPGSDIEALFLYALIERLATQACKSFLEDLERFLTGQKHGPEALFASFLFLAGLERLGTFFSAVDAASAPAAELVKKVADFAELLLGLLRTRKIARPLKEVDGLCVPKDPVEELVKVWYEKLALPADKEAFGLKLCGRFLYLQLN